MILSRREEPSVMIRYNRKLRNSATSKQFVLSCDIRNFIPCKPSVARLQVVFRVEE